MGIKAVVFDLDDTLFPEIEFVRSGFKAAARNIEKNTEYGAPFVYGLLLAEFENERKNVFDRLIERLKLSEQYNAGKLVEIYRSHRPVINLFDDAVYIIDALKKRGLAVGIITDGYHDVQKRKVAALGLDTRIPNIIYTDEWGMVFWKPHEKAFVTMLESLSLEPEDAIYVGDNVRKDFIAPNRLGITSIQIKRADSFYQNAADDEEYANPRHIIRDLREIEGFI